MAKLLKSQFAFSREGYGRYKVMYKTWRGDYWISVVTDMLLIDYTHGTYDPKKKDLATLRDYVKRTGTHYNKHGYAMPDPGNE